MCRVLRQARRRRTGSILVLSAFLLIIMLGMVAFSLDVGVMLLTKTQLQVAADSAAMAAGAVLGSPDNDPVQVAQTYAAKHRVAGNNEVVLNAGDVQNGNWDATTREFIPSDVVGNAVKITARCNNQTGGNGLFFARVFGIDTMDIEASAVAMGNPRDICFVIDLSGSMHYDTEPCWRTSEINSQYGDNLGDQMMQDVYDDFGFGAFPGAQQYLGQPLGVGQNSSAYANLTKNGGPLTSGSINSNYRISSSNSESTRKQKAYRWIIDNQIAVTMPNVIPAPNWTTNYSYWEKYLDYLITSKSVSGRGTLPPNQDSDRLRNLSRGGSSYENRIGYRTYVNFMMNFGRDKKVDGTSYTPLSVSSPLCPKHVEAVGNSSFSFPPREQPTHSARRSLIAAIQVVKERNASVPDSNLRDWVSLVTFDSVSGTQLLLPLTSDYDAVMETLANLQSTHNGMLSTATETGLIFARNHIKPSDQGGAGRLYTNKIVVLATDGNANLKSSSDSAVSAYRSAHPDSNYYGNDYESDAALMQTAMMNGDKWRTFAIMFGTDGDFDFMDRMARMGSTADDHGMAPRTSGDPRTMESELTGTFTRIITSPAVRLVQ